MGEMGELEQRVMELENRFMEQQRLLEELSEALFSQNRMIDGLTRSLQRLSDKLGAPPGLVAAHEDDKPPHY